MYRSINPIVQNGRIKQFTGWFLTLILPFALNGISAFTKENLMSSIIYWVLCGIILRYALEGEIPYLKPKFGRVKIELVIIILITIVLLTLYFKQYQLLYNTDAYGRLYAASFLVLNGCFEPLVFVNIFDLSGCKVKLKGISAVYIFNILMYLINRSRFITMMPLNIFILILEGFSTLIFLIIYLKTRDITFWSIRHILCSISFLMFLA